MHVVYNVQCYNVYKVIYMNVEIIIVINKFFYIVSIMKLYILCFISNTNTFLEYFILLSEPPHSLVARARARFMCARSQFQFPAEASYGMHSVS